jgi:hypothetical protein
MLNLIFGTHRGKKTKGWPMAEVTYSPAELELARTIAESLENHEVHATSGVVDAQDLKDTIIGGHYNLAAVARELLARKAL